MSPIFPQLSFTSMVQMARRYTVIPLRPTFVCDHPIVGYMHFRMVGAVPITSEMHEDAGGHAIEPRTLFLYRYRLDFDEINLHLQGSAQLCPDCLTLYYSLKQVTPKKRYNARK